VTASHNDNGREIMWARVMDNLSFEHAKLTKAETTIQIFGTVLLAQENLPLRVWIWASAPPQMLCQLIGSDWRLAEKRKSGLHGYSFPSSML